MIYFFLCHLQTPPPVSKQKKWKLFHEHLCCVSEDAHNRGVGKTGMWEQEVTQPL